MPDQPPLEGPEAAVARALEAGQLLAELAKQTVAAKQTRHQAVVELRDDHGWSHQQVAEALGVKRGTAQALYEGRSQSGTRRRSPAADA